MAKISSLHKNSSTKQKFIPGIIWFMLILIAICTPGYHLPKVDKWMIVINYDKLVHVGLFAMLVVLFIYPIAFTAISQKQKWQYCIKIALASVIWGLCTELIQKYFIPSRSFDLSDWLANSIGGIIGLYIAKWLFLRKSKIQNS